MNKINLNFIIGLFLLTMGVVIGLEKLDLNINVDYSIVTWSFISLIGLVMIVNDKKITTVPSILVFVGIWNLLNDLGILSGSIFSLIWPIILVIAGINFIFGKGMFNKIPSNIKNGSETLIYNGIFSGVQERLTITDFKGLTANAIFGGVELDLRDVEITDNVRIDISALFGGVTIILPEKYNLTIGESLALFGGTENKFRGKHDDSMKTIYINSRAIFGGVELK